MSENLLKITDVAKAISPKSNYEIIGIRPGEKIHEEMITASDSKLTLDIGENYLIFNNSKIYQDYLKEFKSAKKVFDGFSYTSGANSKFLKVEEIRELIRKNLNKNFIPI